MAERIQRNRQYEYRANSNLVLESERDHRRRDEGSAEVESLFGKLQSIRMGDRLQLVKRPETFDELRNQTKKRKVVENDHFHYGPTGQVKPFEAKTTAMTSVVAGSEDLDAIHYKPRTRETKAVYEEILSVVQATIGDQSHDIIKGAADEVIAILRSLISRDMEKQKEVEKIVGKLTVEKFHRLVALSKGLTDFVSVDAAAAAAAAAANGGNGGGGGGGGDASTLDQEMGVAVVFEDDEDNGDMELEDIESEEEEDEDEGVEAHMGNQLKGANDDTEDSVVDKYDLSVHDIDAHWLQRQLSKFYSDANQTSKLTEDCLAVLQIIDERVCENKLVVLLDFDKFEFIKLLLKNRLKIYFCTRLKQAQSDEERQVIEAEMSSDPRALDILNQLNQKGSAQNWAKDRIGEFTSKARKEAKALNQDSIRSDDSTSRGIGSGAGNGSGDRRGDVDSESTLFLGNQTEPAALASASEDKKLLDLEGLSFKQGGHLMTNKICELPEKSWRALKKGYEEVHVPAVRPIIPAGETLVQIADLPEWAQPAFNGVKSLNRIQSRMVNSALYGTENILLCAPTGAGKTNVALLCMLNQIGNYRLPDGSFDLKAFKIVYIAPMKALVQECVQNFSKRLAPFGIQVKELSGDQSLTRQQIEETQVIVTTPEKWDIITRKSGDRTYTQLVRLIIIDEIHLLHDERGSVLESLVARTIRQIETTQEMVRLVGLSATLPNFEDVATFLRVDPEKGLFFFDNSFRPVPLQQQYIGITEKKAIKRFQLMNEICYEKVLQHAGRNQILIFTHSRADTVKTAKALRDMAIENDTVSQFVREDSASKEILREEAESAIKNPDLKETLPYGFAFHHAGLVRSDRTLVEDLFADKHIQVLISTATLAWGVNLPCHTVIIKGTQMYSPQQGRWVELSPLDILQMMGRAGRYGLDSEGEGIIMTTHSELQYYLSLLNQQLPIESQFIKRLPDMLNAEIVLGNVTNIMEAADWLGYTFLFVRMLRNPDLYGISPEECQSDPSLKKRRVDLAHTAAVILDKNHLIKYDRRSGFFQVTSIGRVASYYYVSHESISTYNEYLKPSMNDIELFRLFSMSQEFKDMHVREEEKLELSKLMSKVPVPVKESIEESSAKINVLLQAYISRLALEGFSLAADMIFVQQSACRLMRALFEIALKRGWASLASKTLNLCKIIEKRTWLSQSPLRQFAQIPDSILKKLEKNSDIAWSRYFDLKPQDLGEMIRIPKMGKSLHKFVHMFPKLDLAAHFLPITRSLIRVDLTVTPDFQFDPEVHDASMLFWILVEDVNGESILHHEPFLLRSRFASSEQVVTFFVPIFDPMPPQYFIKLVSDRWLHSETILPVSFRHLIVPSKFPPPTELLDLQPLPLGALGNRSFERLFPGIRRFNPIQTQTFSALFESSDNALICAPNGTGKTVCAEIALLRHFSRGDGGSGGKAVYLTSHEDALQNVFEKWSETFGDNLDKNVVMLTGDTNKDLKLLEAGDLVLATTTHWDILSRRWKQRKNVQNVALYIFDDLHLIGSTEGPVYEVVVSRARYVASQLEKKTRILGLAASLANAKDVGEWIGAPASMVYNFSPSARPVPFEMHFVGFDINHTSSRLLAMAKPAFNLILSKGDGKPSVVFVPSRKQAQLTAIDFITFLLASSNPSKFQKNLPQEVADRIQDKVLAQLVFHGIAFIHKGLSAADIRVVNTLYAQGFVSILVCPYNYCWALKHQAHLVLILDTVFYDGKEHRLVDYNVSLLLQMLGVASRQNLDDNAKGIIFCHSSKKEYMKKILHDPLPIESHLNHFLHDHMNSEIVTRTVENKQDAVDYLTWTFFYRRLAQNPNYYGLQGSTHRHLSDFLSDLVETVTSDLQSSNCISVEDDYELTPLNLGMVASYYYIHYTTIELFASSLTPKSKTKGLLEVVASATEYSVLEVRSSEDVVLEGLSKAMAFALPQHLSFEDPVSKVLVLLQAHLSRQPLPSELHQDLLSVLQTAFKLLQAAVDVLSSQGWLKPALAAMELSQMLTQGQNDKVSQLFQIPHVDQPIVDRLGALDSPVETVYDLIDMDDDLRIQVLGLESQKVSDIALFCNAYPSIDLSFELSENEVSCGSPVALSVALARDSDDPSAVVSSRYPNPKSLGWWLIVGDKSNNSILTIKKITTQSKALLEFAAPETPGDYNLMLYLMNDSYLGCDQEYEVNLAVLPSDN